jgi:histidyl-tRNA synthetase
MSRSLRPARGMRDVLPAQSRLLTWVQDSSRRVLERAGYEPLDAPIVEPADLFRRALGVGVAAAHQELYTLSDDPAASPQSRRLVPDRKNSEKGGKGQIGAMTKEEEEKKNTVVTS